MDTGSEPVNVVVDRRVGIPLSYTYTDFFANYEGRVIQIFMFGLAAPHVGHERLTNKHTVGIINLFIPPSSKS